MVCEESDEPPRLASAGAERCMRRKVVMKGAEMCAVFVRKGNAIWRILSRFGAMFVVVVIEKGVVIGPAIFHLLYAQCTRSIFRWRSDLLLNSLTLAVIQKA
jgi:hypothetical protein